MENSKQKNSVVMKSQSNNKQGLSKLIPLHQVRNIHFCFSVLPIFSGASALARQRSSIAKEIW